MATEHRASSPAWPTRPRTIEEPKEHTAPRRTTRERRSEDAREHVRFRGLEAASR